MAVPETSSAANKIHSLLNAISGKLVDLPDSVRVSIEDDLQNIRTNLPNDLPSENSDQYRELAESINDGFVELDRDWRFTYVNQRAASNVGYAPADLVGKNMWELFPSLLGTPAEQVFRQVMEQRQPVSIEVASTLTDKWYNNRVYPSARGITIFWIDITNEKQTEALLRESEEKFRFIATNIPETLFFQDLNLRYVWIFNPVDPFDESQVVGRTDADLLPQEEAARLIEIKLDLLQKGSGVKVELPLSLGGITRWYEAVYEPARDADGRIVGVISYSKDITERKRNEELLRYHASLVENISEAVISTDASYNILSWNQAAEMMYGWQADEVLGKPSAGILQTQYLDQTSTADVIHQLQAHGFWKGEVTQPRKDGTRFFVAASIANLNDSAGKTTGVISINRDITGRKLAEGLSLAENQINQILHSTLEPTEILQRSVSAGARALGSDTAALELRKGERWIVSTVYGFPEDVIGTEMDNRQELHGVLAIQTQKPVAVYDAFNDERFNREHLRKWDIRSVLVVPVLLRDEAIGVIFFNYQSSVFEFQQAHIDFGTRLAASLSLALENAQLYQNLKDALSDMAHEKNRLLAVMEALPIGMALVDHQGGNLQANRQYEELWGNPRPIPRSVDEYDAYKAWWVDTGLRVQPEEWASARAVMQGETVTGQYLKIQRFDGTYRFIVNSGAPIHNGQGQITGCAVTIMDITELRRLETVQREHATQMEIQRRLLEYREKERQLIARELHDGPVQGLSSLLFTIQFAKGAIKDPGIQVELEHIGITLKEAVQNLREMINELRPPSLIRFGLARAIQNYLEDFQGKHPEIQLETDLMNDGDCLPEQARLNLYRIVQEALNNTVKHSTATRVSLKMNCTEQQADLEIYDNGKGFPISNDFMDYTQHNHFGLAGMRERAEAIGGELRVSSALNEGTTIFITVPIGKATSG